MSIIYRSRTIHFDAPNVGELEKEYLAKAIDSGFVSSVGPFVTEFEDVFAQYHNMLKAVATQSGTAALHMALYELGIKEGDEVIVPAITFVATVNPILYLGATPIFVDVDEDTWNIDTTKLKEKITDKTKAIIPVHLYGNPCQMDEIMRIAKEFDLSVIEDATESLGAQYHNQLTGSIGDFGCFSFNGNKIITTGGGGMIVGKNIDQLKHIKYLVNQAKGEEPLDEQHGEVGFNHRMTNIEAAVGLAQMQKLESFLNKKRRFAEIYQEELGNHSGLKIQKTYNRCQSSWWCVCMRFDNDRNVDELRGRLQQKGIPTKRILKPVPQYKPYKDFAKDVCAVASKVYASSIALPSSTLNTEDDIIEVARLIKELV